MQKLRTATANLRSRRRSAQRAAGGISEFSDIIFACAVNARRMRRKELWSRSGSSISDVLSRGFRFSLCCHQDSGEELGDVVIFSYIFRGLRGRQAWNQLPISDAPFAPHRNSFYIVLFNDSGAEGKRGKNFRWNFSSAFASRLKFSTQLSFHNQTNLASFLYNMHKALFFHKWEAYTHERSNP